MNTYSERKLEFGRCPECGANDGVLPTCEDLEEYLDGDGDDSDDICNSCCCLPKCIISILCCGLLAFPYAGTRFLCCFCIEKTRKCYTTARLVDNKVITIQPIVSAVNSESAMCNFTISTPQSEEA